MRINLKKLIILLLVIVFAVLAVRYLKTNEEVIDTAKQEPKPSPSAETIQEKPATSRADEILADMTLREKIYQMFIVTPEALSGGETVKSTTTALKNGIEKYPVGGIVYFSGNIVSEKQLKTMISTTSKIGEIPMFIAVDQEGGMVARLKENVGFPIFKNMYEYKDEGGETAYQNAKTIARNMAELGFNLDFAPVADVWSNKKNTVIGKRAYSDDFEQAAELVPNAIKGFHDGGIICTLKHFPGHGATYVDTHEALAYVKKTKEELDKTEILPFEAGIAAGADMVMIGHLLVEKIDKDNPATVSKAVITDYLKNEIGYSGIVITDALDMGAVAEKYSPGQLCTKAVKAGVDILLMPKNLRAAAAGIENAVNSGEISEERINESVRKILELKIKYEIIK